MGCFIFDRQVWGGRLGAGSNTPPTHFDRTDPAATLMPQPFVIAQTWDIYACSVGGLHDGLALIGVDFHAIDLKGKTAHLLKSLS
jgi:hypothetical protein